MAIFKGLSWRLLLAYLAVMGAILGSSALAAYFRFVHILYDQLDNRLLTLAQSAAPSLTAIKTQGDQYVDERDETAWEALFSHKQHSLTWFDEDGHALATQGTITVDLTVDESGSNQPATLTDQSIRTLTIPISRKGAAVPDQIEGYVRASASTQKLEALILQLRLGFAGGGLFALVLSGVGGLLLLQRALEPTRQSYQKLQQFTADASHELRSPLTAMKTSLQVILKHPERIHPKNTKKLAAISSATNQMIALVEDLLFLARAEAAKETQSLEKAPMSVCRVIQELLAILEPQAQTREITFKSALIPDIIVVGDETKISRLFSNLIENAMQYSPKGGMVRVRMEKSARSVFINVEDTGIGIAKNQLGSVFQRLWRTDRARSRRGGGIRFGFTHCPGDRSAT